MWHGSIVPSRRDSLSPQQALKLAKVYLDDAWNEEDLDIALVMCHDSEVALTHARKAEKHASDQAVLEGIAASYIDLGKLLEMRGHGVAARASFKKGTKLGGSIQDHRRPQQPTPPSNSSDAPPLTGVSPGDSPISSSALISLRSTGIFAKDLPPPSTEFKLPDPDERLSSTPQLVFCLGLLQVTPQPEDTLEPAAHNWLQATRNDKDEQDRLALMAMEVVRTFKRDELKDAKVVTEVVCLAPVINKEAFHDLLREFYSGIDHSGLLNLHYLDGLAQLIQGATPGHLNADDLVKILELLSKRLQDTHSQAVNYKYQLTLAVSCVLDAMADTNVKGLDRERLHEPLLSYLGGLQGSSDPYLVYQAAYAFQALLCVPDNETTWQAAMRRTSKVVQGVSGIVSAVKGIDLNKLIEGLADIQQGLGGVARVVEVIKTAYDGASSLAKGGQGFLKCLKDGLSFDRKRDWYAALRGADTLIRDGELASFRRLVCEAPCRLDPAFQWGVCQRLGEIAASSSWDTETRQSAIAFLGEFYRDDEVWGQQVSVKQWIIDTLMRLSQSTDASQSHGAFAQALLQNLESDGDDMKQALYRTCRENGPMAYPFKVDPPGFPLPSLLDRAQNRPDVETNLRLLKRQRTKERANAIYIPPQAKSSLQASDDERFPLMEKAKEFLEGDQKIFLLIGDSGAGKSTFNRELEINLWESYEAKTGRIPLHINLPAIDKPEHDMIAKQLRKDEFTEAQIRELKHHRKFILICDGYDESQQTHNLYVSNKLNQPGEWDARMIISCRTEYLGSDYVSRFQPGDRNHQSDSPLLQAVMTPFSTNQMNEYIQQYVAIHQPLWQAEEYKKSLELVPSLKELVKNPFLMALSLEVLPRIVDPEQHLSTRVTRVALYDHFVEQWFERSKKRLGEKDLSPQARAIFENLSDDGFNQNGMEYLKRLAVAIYKEQDGQPIVEYSGLVDEKSWKSEFFNQGDRRILREACPLTRNGNQHRFIHRSLLEYGLARAVFDPQDRRNKSSSKPFLDRRGSTSSSLSFEIEGTLLESAVIAAEPDFDSPLVWRNFVDDHSLMQFLEERVQQEPVFKDQLLSYIEHSKTDKKWRRAAANAITILVRAGIPFIDTDFQGVQIPGADLSYGVFDSVQLQGADLKKVNLQGIWMRQTDLSGAQMKGVQFGELPLLRQVDTVVSCAYSPDGQSFAVGLAIGRIIVYSTQDWEEVHTLDGHTDEVRSIAYSPKGHQIASCSDDCTIRLWNVVTGQCSYLIIGHTILVMEVAYSLLSDELVSAGDSVLRIWDVATGESRKMLSGHDEWLKCVSFSPDGTQIVSGSYDCTVRLWDYDSGDCKLILSGHSGTVVKIAFSPRGDQVVSGSSDATIRLWDVTTGSCLHILAEHSDWIYGVAYSPDGNRIASGSRDGTVRLWDVETGSCHRTLTGHGNAIFCVAYSPKGDQIASGSGDQTVRLWHVSAGTSRFVSSGHVQAVFGVKHLPKENAIISCSMDCTIGIWDAETGYFQRSLSGHSDTVCSVSYSPHRNQLASGSSDALVLLWDIESGEIQHTLYGHGDMVMSVTFSPQGHQVASASIDEKLRIWDAETGDCIRVLDEHTGPLFSVEYSSDGKLMASCGNDQTVRLWDVESLTCRQVLEGHESVLRSAVFSPSGIQLASAGGDLNPGGDCAVRLWDIESGDCRMKLVGHELRVFCLAYIPSGDMLASGSLDKTVRLWDVATGQCRAVIDHIPDAIRGVCWRVTPDATFLVTGSEDGSVLTWKIAEEAGQYRTTLHRNARNGALVVAGASIQDTRGLSHLNKQLLQQRGAKGEPIYALREATKKVIAMASAVSKLKQPPGGVPIESSSVTSSPAKQPEQLEQLLG